MANGSLIHLHHSQLHRTIAYNIRNTILMPLSQLDGNSSDKIDEFVALGGK